MRVGKLFISLIEIRFTQKLFCHELQLLPPGQAHIISGHGLDGLAPHFRLESEPLILKRSRQLRIGVS